mmetsp:Transcript_22115/g.38956  ORF Transcript_22115/g.38956 Transcript_22115/m.38956 type:complete len:181 (+) Transcript_22115:152-694(+)
MAFSDMTKKLHKSDKEKETWQISLGKVLESPWVAGLVLVLVIVDLHSTIINSILEETDWLDEKYKEQGETAADVTHLVCVTVLSIFLVEQILHLVAFGWEFFDHGWYVMDLCVVVLSLVAETCLEGKFDDVVAMLIVLRLWKVVAFTFDIFLARHEQSEMDEVKEVEPVKTEDKSYGAAA